MLKRSRISYYLTYFEMDNFFIYLLKILFSVILKM